MRPGATIPCLMFLLLLACGAHAEVASTSTELMPRALTHLDARSADLVAFRHDLHRHPEVSGEEVRTAGRIAARLRELGFEVRTGVGGHGVVGVLQGARPGRVVAFRADMDAVRDDTPDPVDYRSLQPGVRHICGHDVHATLGIALAETFAATRDAWPGTLLLLFQPAEETATGASAMLAAGALASPRPDAIFAVHTAPLEVGTFAASSGALMATRDQLRLVAEGDGAEAALDGIVARLKALDDAPPFAPQPNASDFVSIGQGSVVASGTSATAMLDVSLASDAARERVRSALYAAIAHERTAHPQLQLRVHYTPRWVPGVRNDAGAARRAMASVRSEFGDAALLEDIGVVPAFSEDFGHLLGEAPGAMLFLGVSNAARGWVGMPHTPGYVADDAAITVGARALTRVLLDELLRSP